MPARNKGVSEIMASPHCRYRTPGDLYRHAFLRHFQWHATLDSDHAPSIVKQIDVMLELVREDVYMSDMEQVFRQVGERVTEHVEQNEHHDAMRLLGKVKGAVDALPEGRVKQKFALRFGKQFGPYLRGQRVDLAPGAEETE